MSEFARPTSIDWQAGGHVGMARYGDDSKLLVMFYNKAVENAAKSLQQGVRVCENQIYVKIQQPGEHLNVVDRPATDQDKMRFRDRWSQYLLNRQQIPEGTPIDLLFPNNPAFAENLRALGIYTIQQCADLTAEAILNIGRGGQECVNRAKSYLDNASKGVNFHIMQRKIDEYETQFRVQDQQIKALKNQLNAVMGRQTSQDGGSLNPNFIPGYDAQSERINNTHVTKELAEKQNKKITPKTDFKQALEVDAIPPEPTYIPPGKPGITNLPTSVDALPELK